MSCACGFQEDCGEEVHRITTGVWKMFLNYVHEVCFFLSNNRLLHIFHHPGQIPGYLLHLIDAIN